MTDPKPGDVMVCETVAAITPHARIVDATGIRLGGWYMGPNALCGATVAWDTHLPVSAVTCSTCLVALKKMEMLALKERSLAKVQE